MQVTLIASTKVDHQAIDTAVGGFWKNDQNTTDADHLAETGGRLCYWSFSRPSEKTAANEDYLRNIIRQQHFSVLEHASATFLIQGVSRSLTHELIRHRHLSYSQLSQRFVNEEGAEFVVPPAIESVREETSPPGFMEDLMAAHAKNAANAYGTIVDALTKKGFARKQAREAARAVLPNMTETKIVVTGNHRAWREVIKRRDDPAADAEIQLLARELLKQLKEIAPNTYQDL